MHKALTIKLKKKNKFGFIKNKNFCPSKDTLKMNRQVPDWKKVLTMHKPNKGFLFRIYEKLQQVHGKR